MSYITFFSDLFQFIYRHLPIIWGIDTLKCHCGEMAYTAGNEVTYDVISLWNNPQQVPNPYRLHRSHTIGLYSDHACPGPNCPVCVSNATICATVAILPAQ